MNAAFLLMTTAWIAGADNVAMPATPAAPVYSVGTGGCGPGGCGPGGCGIGGCGIGACGACGGCCDTYSGESEGFFSKLKARFHHTSYETDCGCCGGCGSPCDTCDTGHGGGLLDKLRGLFHHSSYEADCGCCDGGCGPVYGNGSVVGGPGGAISPIPSGSMPKAEPLGPPKELKKLPNGDEKKEPTKEKKDPEKEKKDPEKEKKNGNVQLIPQPVDAPELDIAPTSGKSPF
ncbi:MAG TPA: hypothetical protein VKA46_00670 [Gemmataceae bacterium]|nr:hypothetical protein [Gemmataceae bacterium]